MNILIIGNGFDLAHGLPTKYTNFLKYCANYNGDEPVSSNSDMNEEFAAFCGDNFWLKYFYRQIPDIDDIDENTWIDFESEIAKAIKEIEESEIKINSSEEIAGIDRIFKDSPFSKEIFDEYNIFEDGEKNFDNFVYTQLRKFVRAFEIYCLRINKIKINKSNIINTQRKEEIEKTKHNIETYNNQFRIALWHNNVENLRKLKDEENTKLHLLFSEMSSVDYLSLSKFNCVLSFNYTNTYERLYGNDKTKYCYIHGKAQSDREKTDIILGINDDLPPSEQSKNFRWIRFKKYYQRIIFKTGSEYKDWFDNKRERSNSQFDYVHIVGHSLDKTDWDVLYEIFNNHHCKILIYYYNSKDFEDKIQKTIQLLAYKGENGRDELIRRVHGSQWSIKFVYQYDENNGLFIRPVSL